VDTIGAYIVVEIKNTQTPSTQLSREICLAAADGPAAGMDEWYEYI